MKQRKCAGCLQFPLNLVQVSTVASYTTRYEFQQDAQILQKDGYFSQVLSLHQVTVALKPSLLHSFYGSTTNISVYSSSVTAENYFLIPWRERHRQMRQHFPAQFCTGELVTLPKRLPFTPLNILIQRKLIFIYIINILKGFLKSVSQPIKFFGTCRGIQVLSG